ncbi:cyclin-dependent kinase 4 inhibitor B-like [Scleropages formosus]|uniref:Cyclin-dependent kinase 4 inhibitor B-like n=2 Tax=Scleropages formosus TaxID=113540 RepID=A0A8C9SMB9_SCLFO|nr:cyclin-dependent kinase 4 inhibitor B-like [Scleropages formosus]
MDPADELTSAAATGNAELVRTLLESGVAANGLNRFGRTALQVMMMGSVPVARLLLSHGADPNLGDPLTGSTPLHDAARLGFLDTVRLLVRFGARVHATDRNIQRPVDLAQQNGHVDVEAFLRSCRM